MTSQASAGMPPQTRPSSGLGKQPAPPPIPHELLVKPVLDRARPRAAHPEQRALGLLAEFDLEPGGDDARATQPATAEDNDPLPCHQPATEVLAGPVRGVLEPCVRNAAIDHRQVPPAQARPGDALAQIRHAHELQLVRLHQHHDRARTPVAQGAQVGVQVPVPSAGPGMRVALARADGQPETALSHGPRRWLSVVSVSVPPAYRGQWLRE